MPRRKLKSYYVLQHKIAYICTVFFMVLDLRLIERLVVGMTINFFFAHNTSQNSPFIDLLLH